MASSEPRHPLLVEVGPDNTIAMTQVLPEPVAILKA